MTKIHISLVSKEALPVFYVIKMLKPDEVFLLTSVKYKDVAKRIKSILSEQEIICKIIDDIDAFDVTSVKSVCDTIHSKAGSDCEFSYNITAGTKPMAIGAYIAALNHKAKVYYTDSNRFLDLTTFKSEPFEMKVDLQTIFKFQGQELKECEVYKGEPQHVSTSNSILQFIRNNNKLYGKLRKLYDIQKQQHSLSHNCETENAGYRFKDGTLTITATGREVLVLNDAKAVELLFEGRWWEVLVAEAIRKWAVSQKEQYEVWRNVKFSLRKSPSGLDKNEVDILLNLGNKVLFVECKSGTISQDNINKMSVIRQNYGSEKSVSMLISFYPVRSDIREKAKELDIGIIAPDNANGDSLSAIPHRFNKLIEKINA